MRPAPGSLRTPENRKIAEPGSGFERRISFIDRLTAPAPDKAWDL